MLCSLTTLLVLAGSDLTIETATGGKMAPLAERGQKATVCLFVLAECPICRQYSPEINRIVEQYQKKKISFVLVHEDEKVSLKDVRKHQSEFDIRIPTGVDRNHALARLAKASAVPTAAVFDAKGKLLYSGRIDDRFAKVGVQRKNPTKRELRDVLDAVLAGKPIAVKSTEVVGCAISTK